MKLRTGWAVALLVCTAGCSKDEGSAAGTGSDGGHATGGAAGATGTGGAPTGPVITSAPPDWARPADCGGIGDLCVGLGCGSKSVCQAIGNVCIPSVPPGMLLPGKSAERPYCLAFTCMTFEEASCFCTGEAATQNTTCASGPAGVAGLCAADGQPCKDATCCTGLTCMADSPIESACRKACTTNADCDTGCCTDVKDTGQLSCAPKAACDQPCVKRGQPCPSGPTVPNACCNGSCVDSTNPDFAGCRPFCTTNTDCDTGCCVPFSSSTGGLCADSKYCTCPPEGSPCGVNDPPCCDGTTCSGVDSMGIPYACRKNCKIAADCSSGCCSAPFAGKDYGSCLDAAACQAP